MTHRRPPDPDALVEHAAFVRHVARAALRGDDLVDDVVQDTMLAALQAEAPPRGPLRSWLAGIARNRARNLVRQRAATRSREARARPGETAKAVDDVVARAEVGRRVAVAVVSLDEPYRRALLLRYFDGLPPRDIARKLDVPVETARTHVKRGLAQLRTRLESTHGEEPAGWRAALLPLAYSPLGLAGPTSAASVGGIVMGKKVLAVAIALAALVGAGIWLRAWNEKEDSQKLASRGEAAAGPATVGKPSLVGAATPLLPEAPVGTPAAVPSTRGPWRVRVRVPSVVPADLQLVAANAVGEFLEAMPASELAPGELRLEGAPSEAAVRPTHVCASAEGWTAQAVPIAWTGDEDAAHDEGHAVLQAWPVGVLHGLVRDLEGQPVRGMRAVLVALRGRPYYEEVESPSARVRSLLLREQPFVEVTTDSAGSFTVRGLVPGDRVLAKSVDPAWLVMDDLAQHVTGIAAAANNPGVVPEGSSGVLELVGLSRVLGVVHLESGLEGGGGPLALGGWRTLNKRPAEVPEGALRSPYPIPQFMVREWPRALSLESIWLGAASLYERVKKTSLGSATIKALGYRQVAVDFHAWQVGRPLPPTTILEPLRPGPGAPLEIRLTADPDVLLPSDGTVGVHVVDEDDDPMFKHSVVLHLKRHGEDVHLVTPSDVPAGVYQVSSALWDGPLEVRPGRIASSPVLSPRHLRVVEITADFPSERGWSGIETTFFAGAPNPRMSSGGWRNLRRLHQEDYAVARIVHAELGEHVLRYWLRVNAPDEPCPVSVRASGDGLEEVERRAVASPLGTTRLDLSPWPRSKKTSSSAPDRD
ncbi:MAG: sigma-70 family RNA polymerase sigma factor [Planctomycetota bacterium]